MDENKLINRIQYLAHKVFYTMPEGKELLSLMKVLHVSKPAFPRPADEIAAYGGSQSWMAFREGNLSMLMSFDQLAKNYLDKLEAENKSREIL